jgi:hypothetical protein
MAELMHAAPRPSLTGGTEGLRMLRGGRRMDAVLHELGVQACDIDGVDCSLVFVRDRMSPGRGIAVAGEGVPPGTLGRRFNLSDGAVGIALEAGAPVAVSEYAELDRPIQPPAEPVPRLHACASAPIAWHGAVKAALSVASTDPAVTLGDRELDALGQLVDLAGAALEQAEQRDNLEVMVRSSVELLAGAVDARDRDTRAHSDAVVDLATATGRRLGMGEGGIVELEFAARLHDVGKIAVPDSILLKPGPLTRSDWEIMRTHPEAGASMLRSVPELVVVAEIVRSAHERWDGTGYPDGLAGESIPVPSRIIFACDAYDAMMSDRPYRIALGHAAAVRELRAGAGSQFDPRVVEALLDVVGERAQPPVERRLARTA